MFDLVERNSNNCKYINRNIVRLKKLRIELIRRPFIFGYWYQSPSTPIQTINNINITDLDSPWLTKEFPGVSLFRKIVDSIYINLKTNCDFFNGNEIEYAFNDDLEIFSTTTNLDIKYCLVNSIDLTAIIKPDDAIYNCRCISIGEKPKNCLLIGLKTVEESYIVEFEILTKTLIKKDFRI